jgi:hypothetical protein
VLETENAQCAPSNEGGKQTRSIERDRLTDERVAATAWSAVLAIMFGHGLVTVVNQLTGTSLSESGVAASLLALVAIISSAVVLARGPVSVEAVCRVIAPILVVILVGIRHRVHAQLLVGGREPRATGRLQ